MNQSQIEGQDKGHVTYELGDNVGDDSTEVNIRGKSYVDKGTKPVTSLL